MLVGWVDERGGVKRFVTNDKFFIDAFPKLNENYNTTTLSCQIVTRQQQHTSLLSHVAKLPAGHFKLT